MYYFWYWDCNVLWPIFRPISALQIDIIFLLLTRSLYVFIYCLTVVFDSPVLDSI